MVSKLLNGRQATTFFSKNKEFGCLQSPHFWPQLQGCVSFQPKSTLRQNILMPRLYRLFTNNVGLSRTLTLVNSISPPPTWPKRFRWTLRAYIQLKLGNWYRLSKHTHRWAQVSQDEITAPPSLSLTSFVWTLQCRVDKTIKKVFFQCTMVVLISSHGFVYSPTRVCF